jgi:hypothetical protein
VLLLGFHLLQDGEALELGMAEIERLVCARSAVRLAKRFGPRPSGKVRLRAPDRVRSVEHMVVALGPFQEMKGDESRYAIEMAVAREPDLLKIMLRPFPDLESIHRDEHAHTPSMPA